MASKTMNVTVEAWEAANAAKQQGESFSDLLLRRFRPTGLQALVGLVTPEEGEAMLADLDAARKDAIRHTDRRMRDLDWP